MTDSLLFREAIKEGIRRRLDRFIKYNPDSKSVFINAFDAIFLGVTTYKHLTLYSTVKYELFYTDADKKHD